MDETNEINETNEPTEEIKKQARELTEEMNHTGINKRMEICPACGSEDVYYDCIEIPHDDFCNMNPIRYVHCNACDSMWTIHFP